MPNNVTSTNPFLNGTAPKIGGTSTPAVNFQTQAPASTINQGGGQSVTIPAQPTGASTTSPLLPMGSIAKAPVSAPPTNTIPTAQTKPPASAPIDYTLHNGESIDAYNQRIATARGSATAPPPSSTPPPTTPPATPPSTNPTQTNPYTNSGAPGFSGLVGSLASTASGPSQPFLDAQKQAQDALTGLTTSRQNEAEALSLNSQNPIPLEFQQGRGQILQNQYLQQQNAYASEYQGATAQETAATGQQGTQQSGLNEAAGLAAPQQVSPTNVPFSPTTGTYGQPAAGAYGANGLQGVGGIQGQIGIGNTTTQQNALLGSAQATGSALQNLITENNINPSAFTPVNGALQLGAQYTSNTAYQEFAGQVSDFINKMAPILGGPNGATTDYKTQMAGQIINAMASGRSINDVISYFLNQAQKNIQGYSQGGGATGNGVMTPQAGANINANTNSGNTFGSFF